MNAVDAGAPHPGRRPTNATQFAEPVIFGCAAGDLFGWFHPPASPSRDVAVVICAALGYEGISSYSTCARMAERLARAGFPVLRFDYHGTGDSTGHDFMPGRVRAWTDSVHAAVLELRRLSGLARVVAVGTRFGASLAAQAASEQGGYDGIVLFAPAGGRAYARELKMSGSLGDEKARPPVRAASEDFVEAFGFAYTRGTLADIERVDPGKLGVAPAAAALCVPRDDLPPDERLPAHLRSLGVDVSVVTAPGYAAMMREPHESVVPEAVLTAVEDWLVARYPARVPRKTPAANTKQAALRDGDLVEQSAFFGESEHLFGILTGPPPSADSRDAAVLMLNVGTNHRVGPNRMYVTMARDWAARGFPCLRFDLAGMGDSSTADAYSESRLYSKEAATDVRAAIDHLSRTTGARRFVLMGLCSGAYVAFQSALVDPRVTGLVLVNPRRFYWRPGDTLEQEMNRVYKSTRFYRKKLFEVETWRRVARGEVDVRGILQRGASLAEARVKARLARLRGRGADHEENLAHTVRTLCTRGVDTLLMFSSDDDGLDYVEVHLGTRASRLRDVQNFELKLIDGPDHTFTETWSRERLSSLVADHLASRFG